MTFLNPIALFGLAAAAIPVLLHLLNLRKLRRIEFSTLTFLKELQRTRIRRLKLRQLLLLVLRTLVVIMLVLAFSRPTLKGTLAGNIGSHAKITAALIIDDSYSMTLDDEQGELLKQAKQMASAVVDLFQEGDEVTLVRFSDVARGAPDIQPTTIRDLSLLRQEIGDIRSTAVHRTAESALRYAAKLLSSSPDFNKEVYLFSDFQRGVFADPSPPAPKEDLFPSDARFFLAPVGEREARNVSVESIAIPMTIFEKNKPFTVNARFRNNSRTGVRDLVVSLFLDGSRVAQRGVDLQSEGTVDVEFSAVPNSVGFIEGFVELEDDDFEHDNRRYFVVQIPERIQVLLIGRPSDTRYLGLALATELSTGATAFDVKEITTPQLSSSNIEQSDVVVLVGSQGLSPTQTGQLASFVRNGHGMVFFPEPSLSPSWFDSAFARPIGTPPMSGIDRGPAPSVNGQGESFMEFDQVDLRHPIFRGMFEDQQLRTPEQSSRAAPRPVRSIESPRVRSAARYALTPQSTPIITLSNGSAFLVEHRVGSGKVLLYAVAPVLEWSDLPRKGLFVPLVHRSVSYVSQHQAPALETLAGDDVLLNSTTRSAVPWTIRDPARIERTYAPSSSGWLQTLRFSDTDQVGVYSVYAHDALLQRFAVNLNPQESKLLRASTKEIDASLRQIGIERSAVRYVQQVQDLVQTVRTSRFGSELWRHFLVAALILALMEMMVARTGKKETLESR